MKANKFWSIVMMLVVALGTIISFSSCDDDKCPCKSDCHGTQCSAPCADDCLCTHEAAGKYDIIGKWKTSTQNNECLELVFNSNGKGQYNVYYKNELNYDFDFIYSYNKEKGTIAIITDDDPEPWVWSVKFNSANTVQITMPYDDDDDDVYTLTKQ